MLRLSPDVADVAVVGIPDDRLGEVPWAFVVPRDGADRRRRPRSTRSAASTSRRTRCRCGSSRSTRCPATRSARCSSGSSPSVSALPDRPDAMRLRSTPDEERFREELRAWLDATLPTLPDGPAADDWPAHREYDTAWQRRLFDAGYAGISWAKEYGGRAATPSEELIFLEETERRRCPVRRVQFRRHVARRTHDRRGGDGGAEGTAPPADPAAASTSGVRASPNPKPAPISRRCEPRRCATATTTSSPGRRSGRRTRKWPTIASCSCAPDPGRPAPRHHLADHADGPGRHRGPSAARPSPA